MKIATALMAALLGLSTASAQEAFPTTYPAGATPLTGNDITNRLTGKVFKVQSVPNGSWRLEFDKFGYVFVDTARGFRDNGPWRVEGGKWCAKLAKLGESCEELYALGDTLYYKRSKNGEVVPMIPD